MNTWRKILVLLCAITIAFSWGMRQKARNLFPKNLSRLGPFSHSLVLQSFIGAPTQLVADHGG